VRRRTIWTAGLLMLAAGRLVAAGEPPAPFTETPAPAAAEVLTLDDAVALALRNSRRLGVAGLEVERAEQRIAAARTRRLPNLELDAQAGTTLNSIRVTFPAGAFGAFPATGPIPAEDTEVVAPRALSGNVSATLAQPLTQLYRIGLDTKRHELSRDIEREKVREARSAVVAEVRRLYYGLLRTESALATAREQVGVLRELDRVVGEQVAQEVALRADGLEVKARLATAEYERLGLQGDLATSRERMNHLLGRDLSHDFRLAAVPEMTAEEADLPSALARALERRPDLVQARLAVEQADTDRRLKKAESIPEISLAVTYYSFINVDLLPRNIAQAGVQLKWEPFDWGRKGRERAEKVLQVEQARTGARETESQVRLDVAHHFRKLREARLLLQAEAIGRDAARERLRITTLRHREEAVLLKDVLEAQAALSAATTDHDRALLTFWTARADLQKALGEEQ
jgi:outer membrane protein